MTSPSGETNELADLLGPFWTPARVSTALGLREDLLSSAREVGALLGLRASDGNVFYPTFQFHRTTDGSVEVRPELAAMFRELLDHDPWAVAVLVHTPAPELDGRTPHAAARAGVHAELLAGLARTVAREWSAGVAASATAPNRDG